MKLGKPVAASVSVVDEAAPSYATFHDGCDPLTTKSELEDVSVGAMGFPLPSTSAPGPTIALFDASIPPHVATSVDGWPATTAFGASERVRAATTPLSVTTIGLV